MSLSLLAEIFCQVIFVRFKARSIIYLITLTPAEIMPTYYNVCLDKTNKQTAHEKLLKTDEKADDILECFPDQNIGNTECREHIFKQKFNIAQYLQQICFYFPLKTQKFLLETKNNRLSDICSTGNLCKILHCTLHCILHSIVLHTHRIPIPLTTNRLLRQYITRADNFCLVSQSRA